MFNEGNEMYDILVINIKFRIEGKNTDKADKMKS